ncbi:MAG: TonB-dependent receptor plug domain-containing protein [Alistipes sp.]|nr:TonB-dependent receptor plug domain-containing protein [Alistipes sp.]
MKRLLSLVVMLVASAYVASAQQSAKDIPFNGLIISEEGYAIQKMKVQVKGRSRHAVSDKQGRFGLTNVPADAILQFSYKKIKFELPVNGRRSMRVILVDGSVKSAEESQELIDTGYGHVKRREQSSNSGVITGEELRSLGQMDLQEALLGLVPGLQLVNGELTLRGSTSINASSAPLIFVDGMETTTLSTVSINQVESVSVSRDGSMYGARGANGVIHIALIKGVKDE